MKAYGTIINWDGEVEPIPQPANADKFSLAELQDYVGGNIEFAYAPLVPDDIQVIVDEEGLLKSLQYNATAHRTIGVPLFGTVLLVPKEFLND